jgi:hypothetical protein
VIVRVSSWAVTPLMCCAWPLWYSAAPSMFVKNWYAGEASAGLSARSIVYFMLSAVTTLVSGGEKAKSLRI